MPSISEGQAARRTRSWPLEMSSSAAADQPHSPPPPIAQAFLAHLRREIAEGCLRLAALKLIHAADNIAIDDDDAAWPDIDCAEFHLAEGAALLREAAGSA